MLMVCDYFNDGKYRLCVGSQIDLIIERDDIFKCISSNESFWIFFFF